MLRFTTFLVMLFIIVADASAQDEAPPRPPAAKAFPDLPANVFFDKAPPPPAPVPRPSPLGIKAPKLPKAPELPCICTTWEGRLNKIKSLNNAVAKKEIECKREARWLDAERNGIPRKLLPEQFDARCKALAVAFADLKCMGKEVLSLLGDLAKEIKTHEAQWKPGVKHAAPKTKPDMQPAVPPRQEKTSPRGEHT